MRRRASAFVFAHLIGPPLGLLIVGYLCLIDPGPGLHLPAIALALCVFFVLPFLLRLGAGLVTLALLTVTWLTFTILFASYHYGGTSSPFLGWLLTVPLLAVFYLGPSCTVRYVVFPLLLGGVGTLWLIGAERGFPEHVPLQALSGVGAFSLVCAAAFTLMMALTYANAVLAHQVKLEQEMEKQRETERQLVQARDEAHAANRAKSAFLANMSHELRTPLNAIIGFSEMMSMDVWGRLIDARYREYAENIGESGRHLLSIINDVLDLSKIEAGKMEVEEWEEVDLVSVTGQVVRAMHLPARENGVELIHDVSGAVPPVRGSRRMLCQIAFNLLSNSIKFTRRGGTVRVRVLHAPEAECHLVVIDSGIGMSAEEVAVAMTPFGQVDAGLDRWQEGTGLGLPLAKAMAELHGGALRIESAPGQGTTITVSLPVSTRAAGGQQGDNEPTRSNTRDDAPADPGVQRASRP